MARIHRCYCSIWWYLVEIEFIAGADEHHQRCIWLSVVHCQVKLDTNSRLFDITHIYNNWKITFIISHTHTHIFLFVVMNKKSCSLVWWEWILVAIYCVHSWMDSLLVRQFVHVIIVLNKLMFFFLHNKKH